VKKIFPLSVPNHKPPRVIESIKSDVRKYLKRERRKKLPEEIDFWDFDCRIGRDEATAVVAHVSGVIPAIDTAAKEGWENIYIEILAKAGHRTRTASKPPPETDSNDAAESTDEKPSEE
jgi:hypothetical protein